MFFTNKLANNHYHIPRRLTRSDCLYKGEKNMVSLALVGGGGRRKEEGRGGGRVLASVDFRVCAALKWANLIWRR